MKLNEGHRVGILPAGGHFVRPTDLLNNLLDGPLPWENCEVVVKSLQAKVEFMKGLLKSFSAFPSAKC